MYLRRIIFRNREREGRVTSRVLTDLASITLSFRATFVEKTSFVVPRVTRNVASSSFGAEFRATLVARFASKSSNKSKDDQRSN